MASSTNAASDRTASDGTALVRFARSVAHDINNFSTVVQTYSELLLSDLPASDPMHADVAEIHRAAVSTVRYLQRVTLFSRIAHMRPRPTPVSDGITQALAIFAAEHADRTVDVTGEGGVIHADAGWWRDVMTELLHNAHEAAPPGSTMVVRSALHDGMITVEVEDAGDGIPADLESTVTEPFVTSKQGVRGAGMGLAIVATFVDTLGGSLHFERIDSPAGATAGKRTCVRLMLPASHAEGAGR